MYLYKHFPCSNLADLESGPLAHFFVSHMPEGTSFGETLKESRVSVDRTSAVAELITPSLQAMGFDLVRVQLSGSKRPTLQIMAEPQEPREMTVDDCADISRSVSAVLDVYDPIPQAYQLEVSSPGIDRPLTRLKDFERFAGFDARIELAVPRDGRRRFTGRLTGIDGDAVGIDCEGERYWLPFAAIQKAKLILTDALIEAAQSGQV